MNTRSKVAVFGTAALALLGAHCAKSEPTQSVNAVEPDTQATNMRVSIPTENPGVELRSAGRHVTAHFARGTRVRAAARLPQSADQAFEVESIDAPASIRVSTKGARAAKVSIDGGLAHYAGALGEGTDIMHRITGDGTEDYAKFDHAPERSELTYRVELGRGVAHVRQIGNSIEFLDDSGTPRLRMDAPYGVDAKGERFAATTAVNGCAVDTNPAHPTGRTMVAPGNSACDIVVKWGSDVAYPATIDPAWASANTMAQSNISYEMLMAKLTSGMVLVVNGGNSAQLFDPATDTWANTGYPPSASHRTRIAAIAGNKVIIVPSMAVFDGAAGTWAPIAGGDPMDSNGTALVDMGGGKVLLVEGSTGKTRIYDEPNNAFTVKATNTNMGYNPALVALGNGKFAMQAANTQTIRIYDAAGDTWTPSTAGANLAGDANCNAFFPVAGGKIVSYSQDGAVRLVDPAGGTSVTVNLPGTYFATSYLCARTADVPIGGGKYYFSGGRFTYDEGNNTVTDNGAFPSGITFHGAIVKLNDGRYLAAGGNANIASNKVDIYGPSDAADCTGATPVFDGVKLKCLACDGDNGGATPAKCPTAAAPACQMAGGLAGQCTECSATASALCVNTKPLCDTATGKCAACNGGFGSGTTLACKVATAPACAADGSCKAANGDKGTNATAPCPTTANPYVKNDGSCGKCTSNTDCAGATHAGPICDVGTGACSTTCTKATDCSATQYCDAGTKLCTAKKADGAACTDGTQCTAGVCTGGKCGNATTSDAGTSSSGGKDGGTTSSSSSSSGGSDAGSSGASSSSSSSSSGGDTGGGGCSESGTSNKSGVLGLAAVAGALVLGIRRRKERRA